ncbi:MAG: VWA domain-containing protein [Kiritimatiellia bacterium]
MMRFAFPWAFLLLLPWLVVAWRMLRPARSRGTVFAAASQRFGAISRTWRYVLCRVLPILFLFGSFALIVAAAGPRTLLSREIRSADALAVMMSVDVSGSMSGLDLSEGRNDVTRLSVVKETFRDFVSRRSEDLIGLVTFGGYASVRSPLTADHRALLHTLSGVEIPGENGGLDAKGRPISEDELMTAIGDGLAVSLLRLRDAEPKTKIVILLSDGESNVGAVTPQEATKIAASLGVRVYTLGVGSTGMTKVRATDAFGRSVLADVYMTLDEKTLKEIAETTGGTYANVRSPEQLERALKQISELETTRVERQIYIRYNEHARPWLLLGSLTLLVATTGLTLLLRRPL